MDQQKAGEDNRELQADRTSGRWGGEQQVAAAVVVVADGCG